MQRRERFVYAAMVLAGAVALMATSQGHAQALWKYTDKDGKVTYSDKPPAKGENAQLVNNDPAANIIDAPKNAQQAAPEKAQDPKARGVDRDQLRDAMVAARADLESARSALENGREPLPNEVQIVVGRSPTGAPTGANVSNRKPEYYARITSLEEAVKKAEEKVEIAERNYRRGGAS